MASSEDFLELRLKALLDQTSARTPSPACGSVAAIVASLAAALTAMTARFAPEEWPERARVVGRAEELRARLEPLADADAAAYAEFMAGGPREPTIEVPRELAALAAEVAELAGLVAREGNPNVRADAQAGATLAEAAARIATNLVEVNSS